MNIWWFWNLFQWSQHSQKHISGHQNHPSIMPGRWVTPSSWPWPSYWHCLWCLWTSFVSETFSNQLSMIKNKYLDTKSNLLQRQGAELHIEVALDHIVGIFLWVVVYRAVLKPIPINSAWLKTYIWTPRSTFYDARELSYTSKSPRPMLLVYYTSAGSPVMFQDFKKFFFDKSALHTYRSNIIINKKDHRSTFSNWNKNSAIHTLNFLTMGLVLQYWDCSCGSSLAK